MKITYWLILACLIGQTSLVYAEDEAETVVNIETGKIIQTTLHRYIHAYGVVEPEPATTDKAAASSKIAAPVAGIVKKSHCVEGETVTQGFVLFELDSRTADALLAKAQVAADFAQKNFARKQQLNASDNIARKLYDEAEQLLQTTRKDLLAAQTQHELLKITAPLSGTLTTCHVNVGEAVSLNAVLAEVLDLHRLDIAVRVPSLEAVALRLKQAVTIDNDLHGKITFVSPQVDPLTDTVLARVSLAANTRLRTGQLVNVAIVVEERECLAASIDSIVTREKSSQLFIVQGDQAKQQDVIVGLRDGNLIEVQGDGLQAGMTIVTQGSYGLPPETHIRVTKK
jgi:membrane fusion protein (multidrug efflux system)